MEYFDRLTELLEKEKQADRKQYEALMSGVSVQTKRAEGMCWYPVAIRDQVPGRGDYLTIELERTTHQDIIHQLRTGTPARLFSNHQPEEAGLEGFISWQSGDRLKLSTYEEELPDWTRDGKLGVELLFDDNSYNEMRKALTGAAKLTEKKQEGHLVRVLTGLESPAFAKTPSLISSERLNHIQQEALRLILNAEDLAIVHGPPGTGKTTVLVQAIRSMLDIAPEQILVTAASNAAVDLLTEKLSAEGIAVTRIGNPVRVSEKMQSLTLDHKIMNHPLYREIKKMKKRAVEFRDMAHKYKRNFGIAEREQRKALFSEAKSLLNEAFKSEQYIVNDLLDKSQVIAATLTGSGHSVLQDRIFHTLVTDEAGQAMEPASWIPLIKAKKLVLAGDHQQLPPVVKSESTEGGLLISLMEKLVVLYPQSVIMLEEQYRMHQDIMFFSSREFYESGLKANEAVADRRLYPGDHAFVVVDTAGCGYEEKQEAASTYNPEEAGLLVRHLALTLENFYIQNPGARAPEIAVISPYKRQVEELREQLGNTELFKKYAEHISINTIDSFQGQERDIVYISLARSNTDGRIGFLSELRRMNVAMTRARKKLVLIGDSSTLSKFPFYQDLFQYAENLGSWESAWSYHDMG